MKITNGFSSVAYDKADWHAGGQGFPLDQPFQSFVHTGMFLGWIIEHHLCSQQIGLDAVHDFTNRKRTGPQIYAQECDGCLIDYMLNDEGNAFTRHYFDLKRGIYIDDYSKLLARGLPNVYYVKDTWENYEIIKKQIDRRYHNWKTKKWYEFWK